MPLKSAATRARKPSGSAAAATRARKPSGSAAAATVHSEPPPNLKPFLTAADAKAASSDEDESGSSSSDSGEEKAAPPPPNLKPSLTAADAKATSSDEDESGSSSSDSGEEKAAPPPNLEPSAAAVAAKATTSLNEDESGTREEEDGSSSDSGEEAAPPPQNPKLSATAKATAPTPPPTAAATVTAASESVGNRPFQRIWSAEDEIAVLQGLLDYQANRGKIPFSAANRDSYHDFIIKSLRTEVNKSQLFDKLHRIKKKYATSRGKTPSTNPHDSKLYELAQKIWGKPVIDNAAPPDGDANQSVNKKQKTMEDGEAAMPKDRYPFLTEAVARIGDSIQSSVLVMKAIGLIDESKAIVLDDKFKTLKKVQMKNYMHQIDLEREVMKLVMAAMEKLG